MSFEIYCVNPVTQEMYRYVDEMQMVEQINSAVSVVRGDYTSKEDVMSEFESLTGRPFGTDYVGQYFLEEFVSGNRRLRNITFH